MIEYIIYLEKILLSDPIFLILGSLLLLYAGWKIRKIFKNLIFFLYKRKGKKAEKKAFKLLKKNGYEVVKYQPTANGYLYENDEKITFVVRADILVAKESIIYVAEIKSGKAACIKEISTRRQLLEYSKVFNSNKLILIDTNENKIKKIVY